MNTQPLNRAVAVDLDDLPAWTPWAARLLGAAPCRQMEKTAAELEREFEREKWKPLLDRYHAEGARADLETVKDWFFGQGGTSLCSVGERLEAMSTTEARQRHLEWVEAVLARLLPAAALVELGCGFGAMILSLARRPAFAGLPLAAGDFSPSAVALTRLLAAREGIDLVCGHTDFLTEPMLDFEVPPDALVFTSHATMEPHRLPPSFIETLLALRPRVVAHFEPTAQHYDRTKLLGLMRARYLEVNDYNDNLRPLLRTYEEAGRLEIIEESWDNFGVNALCPASLIVWRPRP